MESLSFNDDYLRRLREGDPAVSRHFSAHFGSLVGVKLRGKIRSRELIEDIRQETLLRVINYVRSDKTIDHPERLGAFVHSVCNNVTMELLRSDSRHPRIPEEAPDPPDPNINYDRDIVSAERKRAVARVLDEMAPKDRDLLRMIFLEERDKDEVCKHFGVDSNYLRVLLHRAKNRFRETLGKLGKAAEF